MKWASVMTLGYPKSEIRNPKSEIRKVPLGFRIWNFGLLIAVGLSPLGGCQLMEPLPAIAPPATPPPESAPKLTATQIADVKIAYGRTLEKRGASDQAQAAYYEALKLDPGRADACTRLGVIYDQQCKFDEANAWHHKAVALQPKNPDVHCNLGYSLYLQGKLLDAEKCLRQCLTLATEHARAHNNLGMVLARTDRLDEALAEFRLAGCTEADAQTNLAYAITLEHHWPEARACYERALAADPTSTASRKGLQELDRLIAKAGAAALARDHGPR
jgi:Flp pilus assembly protein TadD